MERKRVPGIGGKTATPPSTPRLPDEAPSRKRGHIAGGYASGAAIPSLPGSDLSLRRSAKAPPRRNGGRSGPFPIAQDHHGEASPMNFAQSTANGTEEAPIRETDSLFEPKREPRITISDPYSILYELERYRGELEVLHLLYREGSASFSRMRQRLRPGQTALERSLRGLVRLGLVSYSRSQSFPFSVVYALTDRGKELVDARFRSWPDVLVE